MDRPRHGPALSRWLRASGLLGVLALIASAASAQSPRIALRWREVPSATAYELQIAADAAFEHIVLETRTPRAMYRWEQLPAETHWWRVRSVDADGRSSEWSPPRTLSVDAAPPDIVRPPEGATVACGLPVEVELAASPMLKAYQLELLLGTEATSAAPTTQAAPLFSFGALAPGHWSARASAVTLGGRTVGPGPVRRFAVRATAPELSAPVEFTLGGGAVSLKWSPVACAVSYAVEVVDDLKERVVLRAAEPRLAFRPTVAGDYRWRVAAVEPGGATGEWSAEASLKVRLPPPEIRGEVVRGTMATMSWTAVAGAQSYEVELQRDDERPMAPIVRRSTATEWASGPLEPGRYRWRVRARDRRGHESAFSEVQVFERPSLRAPVAPRLTAERTAVDRGDRLALSWGAVEGATGYELEVDGEPQRVGLVTTIATPPLTAGVHRMRVRALGRDEDSSYSSAIEVVARGAAVAAVTGELSRGVPPATPPEERSSWVWLGASAGAMTNFGALVSPHGLLRVGLQLPVAQRRLGAEWRLGVLGANAEASSVWLIPSSLLLSWRQPLGGSWTFRAAAGPMLEEALLRVNAAHQSTLAPGFEVTLAVARRLGPGTLELEVGGLYGWLLRADIMTLNAGGVGARLGYLFEL